MVERLLEPVVLQARLAPGHAVGHVGLGQHRRRGRARRPSSGRPPRRCRAGRPGRPPRRASAGPSAARSSRTSSAMYSKKVSTNSGLPLNLARSSGFWVAMPTGQVSRWQTRIMMQPETTSGAVAKPNSSAPSSARDDHVAAGLELAVDLDHDAVPQPVGQQGLLGLGQAELPGDAGVLERGQRGGAGAAVVAGDQHDVGVGLGHAGRHRAHAHLGHQLHVHPGPRVGRLQVVDQLGDVLDGVDVVVRRRRDQPHARRRVPGPGDPRVDLVPRQLAALAGLGPLGDLDLQVVGVDQVLAGHAEAARGHLLDGAAPQVAVGVGREAVGVLAALAGVGPPADAVHGDGEGLVRLGRDRAVGHGAGGEALHDRRRPAPPPRCGIGPARRRLQRAAGRAACPAARTGRRRLRVLLEDRRSASARVACWSLNTVSGLKRWYSPSRRHWYSPPPSSSRCARSVGRGVVGRRCRVRLPRPARRDRRRRCGSRCR